MIRSTAAVFATIAACAAPHDAPDDPTPQAPEAGLVNVGRTVADPSLRPEQVRATAPRAPRLGVGPDVLPDDSRARGITTPLQGLALVPGRGGALEALVNGLPPERRALGLAGLSYEDYLITGNNHCERPLVHQVFEEGGVTWDLGVGIPSNTWFIAPPTPDVGPLPPACADALLVAGGPDDAVDAGCTEADEAAFFPDGSDCRACLDVDGDMARCVADAQCPEEAWARMEQRSNLDGRDHWYYVTRTRMIGCAPLYELEGALLTREPYDTFPMYEPAFEGHCFATWDERDDAPSWACFMADSVGHVVGDTLWAGTTWLRPQGSDALTVENRAFMAREATFQDLDPARWFLAFDGDLGAVTTPVDQPLGWGFDPRRDDGPDPDHHARQYVAAMTLKTSSFVDGIVVSTFERNRCEAGGWVDLGDGTSRCDDVGGWSEDLRNDGLVSWWDQAAGTTYVFPFVTLVSTGLPDPGFPGGFLPHILGSTTLADEGFEGCAWPEVFTPDRMPLYDPAPAEGTPNVATFDAQTWRFGRADDPGVVLGLATSQKRAFCFEDIDR